MENSIRIAVGQLRELTNEDLQFAAQVGVKGVQLNNPSLPGDTRWEYMDLLQLRTRAEDAGMRLEALENTPISFYDHAMLGLPDRDEQIENYQETIRNVGRAGIPILGFHWMPNQGLENVPNDARAGRFESHILRHGTGQNLTCDTRS